MEKHNCQEETYKTVDIYTAKPEKRCRICGRKVGNLTIKEELVTK